MNDTKYFPIHQAEKDRAVEWLESNLTGASVRVPAFSFRYDGASSANFISGWARTVQTRKLDADRTCYTVTYKDGATNLAVRCEALINHKFPQLEWTVYFKNEGEADTPILSEIQAIDSVFFHAEDDKGFESKRVVLHHYKGDYYSIDGYEPHEKRIHNSETYEFHPEGGRPTNVEMPYYRIDSIYGGIYFVLSWQGQWQTSFKREGRNLRIRGGQQTTFLKLHPGEEIRTPLALLMFYDKGDAARAINMWRRWFIEFSMPRVDGELIKPFYANYSGKFLSEMVNANEQNQIEYVNKFLENGIDFDYLWMDAGWYELHGRNTWSMTGTWKVDRKRFPNGLRAISDHAHSKGIKTILWFEPERVEAETELFEEHPDLLLPTNPTPEYIRDRNLPRRRRLFNMADPKAVEWLTDRINSIIRDEGIDLFRQDFNFDPLDYWRKCDEPDRQGILENHYCSGYLRLWDNILATNPGIIIDSCASGGRRNDLETLRRSLPLHKTDYNYDDLTTKQGFHHTLFQWMPFFGSMNWPGDQSDIYYQRSALLMSFHGSENVFEDWFDFDKLREWMQEWRETAHLMYGDYYPLTPWSRDQQSWIGWQFNVPETGEGMVQMFMRPETPFDEGTYKLRGLEADVVYIVKDYNDGGETEYSGGALMNDGYKFRIRRRPDSALLRYWKKKG